MGRAWTYQRVVTVLWDEPRVETRAAAPDDATIVLALGPDGGNYEAWYKCPCGCGDNVVLALKPEKANSYADWEFKTEPTGRPTISPSINCLAGCKSHYFIKDGAVQWC